MSTPCSADSDDDGVAERGAQPAVTTAEQAVVQTLTGHAGQVITAERDRAVRAFDDGNAVSDAAYRTLTTMAVRIAVGLYRPPMAAAAGDETRVEMVADLFLPDE